MLQAANCSFRNGCIFLVELLQRSEEVARRAVLVGVANELGVQLLVALQRQTPTFPVLVLVEEDSV